MDFNSAFNWRGIADTFNKAVYRKDILLELDPELERKNKDSNYRLPFHLQSTLMKKRI